MISAACGLLGAPDQSLIHRSTSKPASSMSKESCSRDGNAICDWEEWSGPSAMIQIISPIASSLVTPRWRELDSNLQFRA
jgi:gas vesicle protein